jgi:PAS domain S-box-containing protein
MLTEPDVPASIFQSMLDLSAFREIFRLSPNPYMVLDRELRFVDANEAYLKATGSSLESIIGRGLFDAFPGGESESEPLHVRQLKRSLSRVVESRTSDTIAFIHYPIEYESEHGRVYEDRYWSATHTPILSTNGDVAYILQHTVDVTDLQETKKALRRAEAELADEDPHRVLIEEGVFRRAQRVQDAHQSVLAEHQRLKRLLGQAPGFLAILHGPDHVFEFANEAYFQVVGRRDLVGKSVSDALPELEGQGFYELLDTVFASGKPFVGRGMIVHLRPIEGQTKEAAVDFIYQPIIEEDGSIYGILVQGHDVSDQYRAQQALEELNTTLEKRVQERTAEVEARNRELQEFAYVASHDLQEPLRKVHSFSDLLVEEYGDLIGDEGKWYFSRIQNSVRRMSLLIKDLLVYSRISTGYRSSELVDLNTVVAEVCADLQLQIEDCDGCVEIKDLPVVHGDPVQLRQLFQNLVSNALKFVRDDVPPMVAVNLVSRRESEVRIAVSDNGIGISPEFAERIFQPFQRLHSRDAYEGTGIGLAVCRRIVERHRGSIEVRSNGEAGSTFVITLPTDAPTSTNGDGNGHPS